MSGTIASRYIAGVPYGPERSVGRYPMRASVGTTPGVVDVPSVGVVPPGVGSGSGVVAPQVSAGGAGGGGSGGGNEMNLLLMAAGLLPYLPQAVDYIGGLFGGGEELPAPPEFFTEDQLISSGVRDAAPGGAWPTITPSIDALAQVGGVGLDPAVARGIALAEDFAGATPTNWAATNGLPAGWEATPTPDSMLTPIDFSAAPVDGFGAAQTQYGGLSSTALPEGGALAASTDPLYGTLGETPLFGGDLATGIAGLGGGALGGWISAQNPWTREGYGGVGQQAGAGLGGIGGGMAAGAMMGAGLGPLGMFAGALGGAFLGGQAGGGIGSQIGPQPTIGRNFSTIGTFGGDGNIYWGQGGGDNGGTADDANAFSNWFGQNLLQQAAAQGLAFNPNMEGVQFNVGGYDQWNRNPSLGGVGGFFYDPYLGGSPENYALRPMGETFGGLGGPGFSPDQAFGADMTGAFTNNVLADLTARGVFTQAGAAQPGRDFYQSTWGADLGSYAPGMSFQDAFGQRQGAIGGWQAGADLRAQAAQQQAANLDLLYGAGSAMPDPTTGMVTGAGGGFTWNISAPGAE